MQCSKTRTELKGKDIALNTYINRESHQINNLLLHLKELTKESKLKSKLEEGQK